MSVPHWRGWLGRVVESNSHGPSRYGLVLLPLSAARRHHWCAQPMKIWLAVDECVCAQPVSLSLPRRSRSFSPLSPCHDTASTRITLTLSARFAAWARRKKARDSLPFVLCAHFAVPYFYFHFSFTFASFSSFSWLAKTGPIYCPSRHPIFGIDPARNQPRVSLPNHLPRTDAA